MTLKKEAQPVMLPDPDRPVVKSCQTSIMCKALVLVSWGHCNKWPQANWLSTAEFILPRSGSLKSEIKGKSSEKDT